MRALIASTFIVACCTSAIAQTFPIIDARHGYLIGAVESEKWIETTDATKSVKPGAKLTVYGMTGKVGEVQVVKMAEQGACPDQPVVKLRPPKMVKGMSMLSGNFCGSAVCAIRSCTLARL
jgi:hypothetical protein